MYGFGFTHTHTYIYIYQIGSYKCMCVLSFMPVLGSMLSLVSGHVFVFM